MQPEPHSVPAGAGGRPAAERLESWKEIAAYLKRDVRTVQRWEKYEQLPVYRHGHGKLSSVYAYGSEIEAWLNGREPAAAPAARALLGRRQWLAAGALLAAVALIWVVARYWFHRPPPGLDIVAQRVWVGPDAHWLGTVARDGRYLSYVDPASRDLMLREIAGGNERRLTSRPKPARWGTTASPVISSDSKQVAYAWLNQDLVYELRLIGISGTGARTLYSNPAWPSIRPMDWSPDGHHILTLLRALDRSGQIVLINSDDGAVHILKTLDGRVPLKMSFSPDGQWVAYDFPPQTDSDNRDLYLLSVAAPPNAGHEIPLVEHSANDALLGWSPDGRMILFASDRTGTGDAWIIRVHQGRPQGAPELVKKDLGMVGPLGFTAQGAFFYARQTPQTDVYIGAIDWKTGTVSAPAELATHAPVGSTSSPDWDASGRYLVYLARHATVMVRELATQAEREVRPALHHLERIRWSGDGRSLLASGIDREGRQGLFRIDATSAVVEIIVPGDLRTSVPEFAPTRGAQSLFYKLQDWDVELGRFAGAGAPLGPVGQFALSPDGRRVAFSTFDGSSQFLKVASASGGQVRELWRGPLASGRIASLAWTPDASQLWFALNDQLWRISVAGGGPERIGLRKAGLTELRISPDGTRLAFTAGQGKGEVWEMQHFLPRN